MMLEKGTVPILEVESLSVSFTHYVRGLRQQTLQVISDLAVCVHAGEMVAIVGASGSGKSLLAHAILGILPKNALASGTMSFKGKPLDHLRQEQLRGTEIAFVPQSIACLDPLMKVGEQVRGFRGRAQRQRKAFKRAHLDETVESLYPFQLSGGMARRVLVSTAVVEDADLIIADEPTPGLTHDMAVEALQTFRDFADQGKGVILITHDLDLAYEMADTIVVFYAGTTLEIASACDFRKGPHSLRHPYSQALWRALPQNGFIPTKGSQPYAGDISDACPYAHACPRQTSSCLQSGTIPLTTVRSGKVRCLHAS